jgi:hypothetical protein
MYGYIFRMHELQNLRLRTSFLAHLFLLGPADDAVQGLLGQRTPVVWRLVFSRLTVLAGLFRGELHLSVQHVTAETVVFVEKLLDSERCLEGSIQSSPIDKIFLTHREKDFLMLNLVLDAMSLMDDALFMAFSNSIAKLRNKIEACKFSLLISHDFLQMLNLLSKNKLR